MEHDAAFLKLVNSQREQVNEISIEKVRAMQIGCEPFVLIDVREDHEWDAGHIPGAIHLGRGILERDIGKSSVKPDQTIVLYCGGGFRSILSAANLQVMGYQHVWSMDGGFRGWREAGLAIAKGD